MRRKRDVETVGKCVGIEILSVEKKWNLREEILTRKKILTVMGEVTCEKDIRYEATG
jgi:hypothetical protein